MNGASPKTSGNLVASATKRSRRTRAELAELDATICQVAEEHQPITARGIYYQLEAAGKIDKTHRDYKAVIRRLVEMRDSGRLPYDWIADSTRWVRRPTTYTGPINALMQTAKFYRRAVWADAEVRCEIWCEKDALAGVIVDETDFYDVPLMVTRGYSSVSFAHAAARAILDARRPTYLYLFRDHDPSGLDAARVLEKRLREFVGDAVPVEFEAVAVTLHQIEEYGLRTRPTKQTDTRAKGFIGGSVELDAISPNELRRLVRECIERHVDQSHLNKLQVAEESERDVLMSWATDLAAGGAT